MRENFVYLHRNHTERFIYDRDRDGRLCGVPTRAWHAVLLDMRTKTLLGFLTADHRNEVWNMLEDEVYDRAVDRAANAGDPDQLRPDEPNDDDDAINHHAAQANGNPMFLGLNEFEVVDVPPAGIHAVNPLHTLRTDVAREIMTLRRQPTMAADGNPLLHYRDNETHYPYIIPVARAILAMPASSAPSEREGFFYCRLGDAGEPWSTGPVDRRGCSFPQRIL